MQTWLKNIPLRGKCMLTVLLIEAMMFVLLVGNSVRLNNAELQLQARQRVQEISHTLVAAIAPWLAQHDQATAHEILLTRHRQGQLTGITLRNQTGHVVRLQADEPEDMYHLFNLICEGDTVTADTVRNVSISLTILKALPGE